MNLTTTHLTYWRERQRVPRWARDILAKKEAHALRYAFLAPTARFTVSIDAIVNVNAGTGSRPHDAAMLCHLLRMARKHSGATGQRALLVKLRLDPYPTDSPKRRAYASRWLRKLAKANRHA